MGTRSPLRLGAALVVVATVAAGCSSTGSDDTTGSTTSTDEDQGQETVEALNAAEFGRARFGPAPEAPQGALPTALSDALDDVLAGSLGDFSTSTSASLSALGRSSDPRIGWILSDLLRFETDLDVRRELIAASSELLGIQLVDPIAWGELTNHLIAWDTPATPDYISYKRQIFLSVLPAWEPLFDEGTIDWRYVSWGGVAIDARPYDTTNDPCNCIPAIDNPTHTTAEDADWLVDSDVVFGVVIDGEARAYPRRIMEVREMVNDTLGGRDFAMPYCTLCGAAQVWFTDDLPNGIERPIFRTSGLLSRSNKVMFDLNTFSVFDTFVGDALNGPLAESGVELEGHTVVSATWGEWKAAHPETTVLTEDLALGRDFDFRSGRDANGPIFPIGDVDPRLDVQTDVLGVTAPDGTLVAFDVEEAVSTLQRGDVVESAGVSLELIGGGVSAFDQNGDPIVGHQAFWFAWSQFHPETLVWPGDQ